MDGRKQRRKRKTELKQRKGKISFQNFIDGISGVLNERKEMEDLFGRVLMLNSESVLAEMEIKKKNNEILQAHMWTKAEENNKRNNENVPINEEKNSLC
jgi:hypothetical protein